VTPLALVNGYLGANLLVVGVLLMMACARAVSRRLARPFTFRHLLQLGYVLSVAAVFLPLVGVLSDHKPIVPHAVDVWSASTMHDRAQGDAGDHQIAMVLAPERVSIKLVSAIRVAGYLFASGLIVMLAIVVYDALMAATIIARAALLRRHGQVRVLGSDQTDVPFSFWIPGRRFIVVPSSLILRPAELRMALEHEAQHHRQADTKVLYLYQLLRALFWWNPAVHSLTRQIRDLQEFACDEAVLRRRGGSAHDYCRCLLWVAQSAQGQSRGLVRAAMASGSRRVLVRRIETALAPPAQYRRLGEVALAGVLGIALLIAAAIAISAPIQDRRISAPEAERMAQIAQRDSGFPISMNDQVLEQLNLMLGTPDGRAHLRASLARMTKYESMITERIERHGLPKELLAVPLVEAGYRNLPPRVPAQHGAGLWMFIESTARRFGLEVTDTEDQRLDVERETEAAMRMLSGLHSQFDDWHLALLAYNGGQWRVERGIRDTGSRDAWGLVRQGYENDANYLSRIMAAILIIKNPAVLDY
jgi:membrane-bound lytic murein transglycosylase D